MVIKASKLLNEAVTMTSLSHLFCQYFSETWLKRLVIMDLINNLLTVNVHLAKLVPTLPLLVTPILQLIYVKCSFFRMSLDDASNKSKICYCYCSYVFDCPCSHSVDTLNVEHFVPPATSEACPHSECKH